MTPIQAEGTTERETVRVPLGVPARIIMIGTTLSVVLDDLTIAGARITLAKPCRFQTGVLQWLEYECFADLAWQNGLAVGLRFERPIACQTLVETCRQAPGLLERSSDRSQAQAWIQGSRGC